MSETPTYRKVLDDTLAWSAAQGFRGWNKHDGLNSPVLRPILNWGKWPRILAIQGVMRFPLNLRPLLLVPHVFNPKGLALFVHAYLDRFRIDRNEEDRRQALSLLAQLVAARSPGQWSGICWGYHYPWRDPGFYAPTNTPNAVVTAFVCEAFLDAYRLTKNQEHLQIVRSAIDFLLNDLLPLKDEPEELCLSYMPRPMTMRVMDVSILIGSVLTQYAELSGDQSCRDQGVRLIEYVVRRQTADGAWFYTDPPEGSRIRHDNYHTGFILDALFRSINATGLSRWNAAYMRGLEFYANNLFNTDGSPRWMSDVDYPHDVHGAAQGVITFSRHRDRFPQLAERILQWTLNNLYHSEGRFFYQETRHYTKRFTLLRWCNGWMSRAMATWLAEVEHG